MTGGSGPLAGRRLLARADASATAGTGHLMRVLALAQAWLDEGGRARFLVAEAPDRLLARLEAEGVEVRPLRVAPGGREDGAALASALGEDPSAVAVVDGLGFDESFFAALGDAGRRVLFVDDMARLPAYPVGFVLNQNAHADRAAFPADAACRFLLGPRYVLLRREFRADPPARPVPARAQRILATFGGADPARLTYRTLEALGRLPAGLRAGLEVRLVVGAANPDAARIEAAAAEPAVGLRVTVLHAVEDMPAQLAWADLAVTSGGSTVWELARMGCPAIVVETVPVETLLAGGLARVGLFARLGPEAGLDGATIAAEIAGRIDDPAWRAATAALGRQLVDGAGARRVARIVAGLDPAEQEGT